jgi:stage II sporulation protein D
VVARTFTLYYTNKGDKHAGADVCTDSTCCQSYFSETDYIAAGGLQWEVDKMRNAIAETKDQILTFNGDLVMASYFSCSGGRTEDAVAVWGTEVPYLQSVESPGEEQALHYADTVIFTPEEFASMLQIPMERDPAGWIDDVVYTEGGSVGTMHIGGELFTGMQLRSMLGLRSAAFSVAAEKDQIVITTKGYGHRGGMSQYGAEAMASNGASYEEILKYYYQGTEITRLQTEIYG